jgi:hypothetical protein
MNDIIKKFKSFIDTNDLNAAKTYFESIVTKDDIAWEYVFQKVYLHACLKKRKSFVDWLMPLFEMLDPIQQIGVRQMFPYGRFLLNKL